MQPAPPSPAVEYAERSDPGRDPEKQVNEDACGHAETRFGHLCVVCDGMGGHAAGREAAELAVATIFEMFERAADGTPPGQVLKGAIEEASRRVHFMRTSEIAGGRPGATTVAVLMHAQGTEVAHVGDSRVYLVHEGQIFRITRDHSVVQELVDRGLLTLQQAAHHPDANRITRALGMAPEVEAELRPQPVHQVPGDAFVLCSDGLSDLVEDHEILDIVGSSPAAQAVGKLVDLANARGGHDNITVIVLRAREAATAPVTGLPPTIAQTSFTTAPDTVADTSPPVMDPHVNQAVDVASEPRVDRKTEPLIVAPVVIPPAPEPPPPPSSPGLPEPRATNPGVIVAVVLAVAAMLLLGGVLLSHLRERAGKPSERGSLGLPSFDAQVATPTTLAPGSIVVPTSDSAAPIAPLQPSPVKSGTPSR
jgi:serine/threonine protein phosphatase PrpC